MALQAAGTVAGGALGFLVMLHPTTLLISVLRARQHYLMILLNRLSSSCLCGFAQVALQAAGTIAGGTLGFLVMLHPMTATQPIILAAVMVAAAAVVGLASPTSARVGITLTLMTLSALVLCQVRGAGCRARKWCG